MRRALPLAAVACTLALAGSSGAASPKVVQPGALQGLKAFLLRADDPVQTTFSRTPSFAWSPVPSARSYQFQLATSRTFRDGTIVWSTDQLPDPLTSPDVALPISLPWMTGDPYALYARVRAILQGGSTTAWSAPVGFDTSWPLVPAPLEARPGLLRWTPVPGATSYDVWLTDANRHLTTVTNVADERELYTFHDGPSWIGVVHWRVRAVRNVPDGSGVATGLPIETKGPWSPLYTTINTPPVGGQITLDAAVSDTISYPGHVRAHALTPGFHFYGNQTLDGQVASLFRVYVFTDRQCLNVVYRSPVFGGPAYAPRTSGPLALPTTTAGLTAAASSYLTTGSAPPSFAVDDPNTPLKDSEEAAITGPAAPPTVAPAQGGTATQPATTTTPGAPSTTAPTTTTTTPGTTTTTPGTTTTTPGTTTTTPGTTTTTPGTTTTPSSGSSPSGTSGTAPASGTTTAPPAGAASSGPPVDLWDSGWPNGRFYWTVIGVNAEVTGGSVTYVEMEMPQEACAAGRVAEFGKISQPVLAASSSTPYATGLAPDGRLVAAVKPSPSFYGTPLVSWEPALGATSYEVQWSRTRYPWQPAGTLSVPGTSTLLDQLTPGKWYYRVRGIDENMPAAVRAMSWSAPVALVVAQPDFSVLPSKSAKTAALPKGMVLKSGPGGSFTIAVPKAWTQLDTSSPALAPLAQAVPPAHTLDFVSVDEGASGGFGTNLNVISGPGRGSATYAQWTRGLLDELRQTAPGATDVSQGTVEGRYGRLVWLSYQATDLQGRQLTFVQFALPLRNRSWLLTYTTLASKAKALGGLFLASAKTFRPLTIAA